MTEGIPEKAKPTDELIAFTCGIMLDEVDDYQRAVALAASAHAYPIGRADGEAQALAQVITCPKCDGKGCAWVHGVWSGCPLCGGSGDGTILQPILVGTGRVTLRSLVEREGTT